MEPVTTILGVSFSHISAHGENLEWFECKIDESRYAVDGGYKITLRNINGSEYKHYYRCDFDRLIEDGCIIPKTSEKMHIENISFKEYIPGTCAYVLHEGQYIVE
jgi:hypothetical protein